MTLGRFLNFSACCLPRTEHVATLKGQRGNIPGFLCTDTAQTAFKECARCPNKIVFMDISFSEHFHMSQNSLLLFLIFIHISWDVLRRVMGQIWLQAVSDNC